MLSISPRERTRKAHEHRGTASSDGSSAGNSFPSYTEGSRRRIEHDEEKGLGSILLGAVLIGASFLFPGTLGMSGFFAGLSMVAGGASLLLTPEVGVKDDSDQKSYSFNGPLNSDGQGGVEPVIYGEAVAGSVVMAASIKSTNSKA